MNVIRQHAVPVFSARTGVAQITSGALRAETVIKNCSTFIRLKSAPVVRSRRIIKGAET